MDNIIERDQTSEEKTSPKQDSTKQSGTINTYDKKKPKLSHLNAIISLFGLGPFPDFFVNFSENALFLVFIVNAVYLSDQLAAL